MKKLVLFFFISCIAFFLEGQKFHLRSGVGLSTLHWYENQVTANFAIQLNYQKKNSPLLFYGDLKTLGNVIDTKVDPAKYEFIPQTPSNSQYMYPSLDVNQLSSYYRGGSMEVGIQFNQRKKITKPHFSPELSLYSISFARKISSDKTNYVEEEKYALHGLTGGVGIHFPGKTKFSFKSKLFLPVYTNFILYGRYVGIPYESSNQENNLCYRNAAEISFKKFNIVLEYDIINLGKSENIKSKTIPSSQSKIASLYFNYLF
ncbi:MAG: hypothetical protein RJA76_890 [Bacteroidota bacterium]|jgi:hypothetical protein